MPMCVALHCCSGTEKDVAKTFHKFPFDKPKLLEQWIINMKRNDWKPTPSSVLCSDHFDETCFDRSAEMPCIREGAIPTIFIKEEYASTPTNIESEMDDSTTKIKEESSTNPTPNCPSKESSEESKQKLILTQIQFQSKTSHQRMKLLQQRSRRLKKLVNRSQLLLLMTQAQDAMKES